MEEDLYKFSSATYFSEVDLCRAYCQVSLSNHGRALIAFPSHLGLMEFCRMPFGLVTASSTYIWLMRLVLAGLRNVCFYFDDVFVFSTSYDEHLDALCSVLNVCGTTTLPSNHLNAILGLPQSTISTPSLTEHPYAIIMAKLRP